MVKKKGLKNLFLLSKGERKEYKQSRVLYERKGIIPKKLTTRNIQLLRQAKTQQKLRTERNVIPNTTGYIPLENIMDEIKYSSNLLP